MLRANRLEKNFSPETVLKSVSLSLRSGELAGLIGTSGSGKTVLARCLTGLESFDAGEVEVEDLHLAAASDVDAPRATQMRRLVGLVPQNRALPTYRTCVDLVREGPRHVLGLSRADASARATALLTTLGLEQHTHKYTTELSGGQLTRLCLARAMAMRPKYLLCDEVTANLDPVRAAEVGQLLVEIAREGVGVLFISHQFEFLRRFASTVHYLHEGEIAASGPPGEIFERPADDRLRRFLNQAELGR